MRLGLRWFVPLGLVVAGPLLGQTRDAPVDPATIVPPALIQATSTVPTQIVLTWPAVPGAEGYRVTRSSSAGDRETIVAEGPAATFALDRGMCRGAMPCWFANQPVGLRPLYSYRVQSVFPGPTYSAQSLIVTATSATFLAPTNLAHAMVPSTLKPGQLQVTVSWLPVSGAEAYHVVPTTPGLPTTTVRTASVRFDPLRPGASYGLCVSVVYPRNIRDDAVRSCITLVL